MGVEHKTTSRTKINTFFFKQWGTWSKEGVKGNKKKNGKLLQGEVIQQMPKVVHENFRNKDQTKFWE